MTELWHFIAMGLIRKIMQDRSSAGAIAMLALLLFLLHGVATGVSSGSMAAMALSDDVICSSHMPEGMTGKQDKTSKLADNCCGTVCRLASNVAMTLPAAPSQLAIGVTPSIDITFFRHVAKAPPPPPNRDSQPRGPPLTSQA